MVKEELKTFIDLSVEHMAMASRMEVMTENVTQEEIFEYIAEAGRKYFEEVFGMNEEEFLEKLAKDAAEILLRDLERNFGKADE